MSYDREAALLVLKKHLAPDRVKHSLGVERYAARLARIHREEEELCSAAGLLHDMARDQSNEKMIALAKQYGYKVDELLIKYPKLLHGPASAELARQLLGLDNPSVLSAIANHTIPSECMTKMDKIIFIADKLEDGRDYTGINELRELSESNLDQCLYVLIKQTVNYLLSTNQIIHPGTIRTYNTCIEVK